jgi:hypothetical protein
MWLGTRRRSAADSVSMQEEHGRSEKRLRRSALELDGQPYRLAVINIAGYTHPALIIAPTEIFMRPFAACAAFYSRKPFSCNRSSVLTEETLRLPTETS